MADTSRRHFNGGAGPNRKRHYKGASVLASLLRGVTTGVLLFIQTDDGDFDRRAQRRRFDEPVHIKLRKQLLGLAESVGILLPLKSTQANEGSRPGPWRMT